MPLVQDINLGYARVQVHPSGEDRAVQSEKRSADVNWIVERYRSDPSSFPLASVDAVYSDVSAIGSYHDALETVRRANARFMELPAKARKVFGNDPARFLDAVKTDDRSLLEEAGIVEPVVAPVVETPVEGPAAPDPEAE
jgi:hypothetical protein